MFPKQAFVLGAAVGWIHQRSSGSFPPAAGDAHRDRCTFGEVPPPAISGGHIRRPSLTHEGDWSRVAAAGLATGPREDREPAAQRPVKSGVQQASHERIPQPQQGAEQGAAQARRRDATHRSSRSHVTLNRPASRSGGSRPSPPASAVAGGARAERRGRAPGEQDIEAALRSRQDIRVPEATSHHDRVEVGVSLRTGCRLHCVGSRVRHPAIVGPSARSKPRDQFAGPCPR